MDGLTRDPLELICTTTKTSKTAAQRSRECRARLGTMRYPERQKTAHKVPKTSAQRSREYRQRKKALRQIAELGVSTETAFGLFAESEDVRYFERFALPGAFKQLALIQRQNNSGETDRKSDKERNPKLKRPKKQKPSNDEESWLKYSSFIADSIRNIQNKQIQSWVRFQIHAVLYQAEQIAIKENGNQSLIENSISNFSDMKGIPKEDEYDKGAKSNSGDTISGSNDSGEKCV